MDHRFNLKNTRNLAFQRNVLAGVVCALFFIVFLQTILLFFKNDKIIITPPELKESFWVEGKKFSQSYLEEMANLFAHLLLDISIDNCLYNGSVLLRYVDSSQTEKFRLMIRQSHELLKKDSSSSNFNLTSCVVKDDLSLVLKGVLHTYVAGKRVSSHIEEYRMSFSSKGGQLFLKEFTPLNRDEKPINEENDDFNDEN